MTHDALALRGLTALVAADAAALYLESGAVLHAGDADIGEILASGDPSIGIARHSGRGWTCLVGAAAPASRPQRTSTRSSSRRAGGRPPSPPAWPAWSGGTSRTRWTTCGTR